MRKTGLNALSLPAVAIGLGVLTVLLLRALGGGSPAAAGTDIQLDSFRADNSPASAEGPVLAAGQQYEITITGTWSYWFEFDWENRGVCRGVPEDMPMFPSPGTTNGLVGDDAAWSFASPDDLSDCNDPVPEDRSFDVSLDGGATEIEIDPVDAGAGPNVQHTYHYMVTGEGDNIVFLLNDEKTEDNYGILMITVNEVPTPTPSPAGEMFVWGDANCAMGANPVDSLLTLRHDAGLGVNSGGCPELGTEVDIAFASVHQWGDVDCSGAVDPIDSLKILRYDAGLSVSQELECPQIGTDVTVQGLQ